MTHICRLDDGLRLMTIPSHSFTTGILFTGVVPASRRMDELEKEHRCPFNDKALVPSRL